jgi:hypothetical protein
MTMTAALGDATVAELRSAIGGTVTVPGDPDYELARRIWNYAIDRYPAIIVRCTGTADVVAGVRFARSEGLPIAVRGGKHSVAGFSTCDDGLVLDLTPMSAVQVDVGAGRAGHRAALHGSSSIARLSSTAWRPRVVWSHRLDWEASPSAAELGSWCASMA